MQPAIRQYNSIFDRVPQSSMLGPLLFFLYSSLFYAYLKYYHHHFYAEIVRLKSILLNQMQLIIVCNYLLITFISTPVILRYNLITHKLWLNKLVKWKNGWLSSKAIWTSVAWHSVKSNLFAVLVFFLARIN